MTDEIIVGVLVNDPDHGLPTGRLAGADFNTDELSLESGFWYDSDNPTFAYLPDNRMRVGRHVYEISGYQTHVGNWCWDAVRMHRHVAKRLVANLLARGFTADEHWVSTDLLPESVANRD